MGPIDFSDLVALSNHAIYAGDLADRIEKHHRRYLLLLDSCYEGTPATIPPDILTPTAAESLRLSFAPLRYMNEFHQANPVVYSTAPGTIVATVTNPLEPDSVHLIGPLARRAILATRDGSAKSLAAFLAALLDPALDAATSPAISWADLTGHDHPLLRASYSQPPTPFQTVIGTGRPQGREKAPR